MSVQYILDTGRVTGSEPTETLQEVLTIADFQLKLVGDSLALGSSAEQLVHRLHTLTAQILPILNRRRGLDGMTPLQD